MAPLRLNVLVGLLLTACAPRLPVPAGATHTGDEYVAVPYPPPPAKVEIPPTAPSERAVWVDGHWQWNGGGYGWTPGQWLVPESGAAYARPTLVRLRNGDLLYYEGTWKSAPSK